MVDQPLEIPSQTEKSNYASQGLSEAEVLAQRQIYGANKLPTAKGRSAWSILISQFKNPLIYIILVAAAISLIMGEYNDFIFIIVVVIIDVVLGFSQEYQAHKTYTALKNMLRITTSVIRGGVRQEIDASELVPGDLVILNAGEHVPGDGIILSGTKLTIDEAILTGESEPVNKTSQDGQNQAFMGTTIVTGRGYLQIVNTGAKTEIGKIASSQQENPQERTPLQIRLEHFSRTLTFLVLGITLLIFVIGVITRRPILDMLRVSIVLAIAAVPEGLPIAVTIIQVIGMRKIFKRNGLVQKLLAVETLGSVTVICTDKTGTLTEGHMRVVRSDFPNQQLAGETMALCNNLEGPVDAALWEFAETGLACHPEQIVKQSERISEIMFTSESKYMVTENRREGSLCIYLKGAPEIVLAKCQMGSAERQRTLAQINEWAGAGLRLLALAFKTSGSLEDNDGFTWNGLVGLEDPIREGVVEAVQVARRAGVQVKMITGDYKLTAEHIAKNIGILDENALVMDGEELNILDDNQLKALIGRVSVFARIRPFDKLRIISTLQDCGEITAMIGDGVNDAPALQRANIGVVVGSATDVAKESADLILMDNNFRTIVAAIEEGRVIFENIQKVVSYVLSNSFAEIILIFIAMLAGWPAPLLVAQILWIHLICDGPADIMLGFEPKEAGIMEKRPKSMKEQILTPLGFSLILFISSACAIVGLILFDLTLHNSGSVELARSLVFAVFCVVDMIYIFAYKSLHISILKGNSLLSNKPLLISAIGGILTAFAAFLITPLRHALKLIPLTFKDYLLVFGIGIAMLVFVEIGKWIVRLKHKLLD